VSERSACKPLPRAFFDRPTTEVARELLGKVLVRRIDIPGAPSQSVSASPGVVRARIVEVEAYLGERDAASHARRGPTPRAAIMFGPPGHLYVYLIYGMHHCMNFVTESDGCAGAVLIRAAEPLAVAPLPAVSVPGAKRGVPGRARPLSGPGKLCSGLGITLADNGLDLTTGGALFIADDGTRPPRLASSPRVGVDYAGAWAARKLRFYVPGNPNVSGRPRT
jgi:DNA-3-methyladenine glycosylase